MKKESGYWKMSFQDRRTKEGNADRQAAGIKHT